MSSLFLLPVQLFQIKSWNVVLPAKVTKVKRETIIIISSSVLEVKY